jgi:Flp pilus assembly pilin Flp
VRELFARFCRDEQGQDLIEYGLLLGIIGISALLVVPGLQNHMKTAFQGWGTNVHNIWVPNDPS